MPGPRKAPDRIGVFSDSSRSIRRNRRGKEEERGCSGSGGVGPPWADGERSLRRSRSSCAARSLPHPPTASITTLCAAADRVSLPLGKTIPRPGSRPSPAILRVRLCHFRATSSPPRVNSFASAATAAIRPKGISISPASVRVMRRHPPPEFSSRPATGSRTGRCPRRTNPLRATHSAAVL